MNQAKNELVKYSDPYAALGIPKKEREINVTELISQEISELKQSLDRHQLILSGLAEKRQQLTEELNTVQRQFSVVEIIHNRSKAALQDWEKPKVAAKIPQPQKEDDSMDNMPEGALAALTAFSKCSDPNGALTLGDMQVLGGCQKKDIHYFIYDYNRKNRVVELAERPREAQVHFKTQFWKLTAKGKEMLNTLNS